MSYIMFDQYPWVINIDWPKTDQEEDGFSKSDFPGQDVLHRADMIETWLNEQIQDWVPDCIEGIIVTRMESYRIRVKDKVTATMVLLRWL